jgi:hypothetical protein
VWVVEHKLSQQEPSIPHVTPSASFKHVVRAVNSDQPTAAAAAATGSGLDSVLATAAACCFAVARLLATMQLQLHSQQQLRHELLPLRQPLLVLHRHGPLNTLGWRVSGLCLAAVGGVIDGGRNAPALLRLQLLQLMPAGAAAVIKGLVAPASVLLQGRNSRQCSGQQTELVEAASLLVQGGGKSNQ